MPIESTVCPIPTIDSTRACASAGTGIPRFTVGGIDVAAVDVPRACGIIAEAAVSGRPAYVTVTGAHGVVESVHDPSARQAHQGALMVVPDGMPLVWLGRLLGCESIGRVYGPDLMLAMFSNEEYRALRHFFYGSNPSVIAALQNAIVSRFGHFNLVGSYCPPMRPAGFREDDAVISRIREARPHIVWVGLSTPKQELWLHRHMKDIGCGVGIGAGAAFDLVSGSLRQAPRWIQRSGLEWLFRLVIEPRRLFRRYFFVVPRFACLFLGRLLRPRGAVLHPAGQAQTGKS
jgi:N-acetylglucosaminyldiphosphoundecaprenol N-acetyl-beta-D-mannosaminyltransferase